MRNDKFNFSAIKDNIVENAGLRSYMISVYNNMAIALLITGIIAFLVSSSGASKFIMPILYQPLVAIIVMLSPVFLVFYMSTRFMHMSLEKAKGCLWLYSALIGLSISSIFLLYTSVSIFRAFLITSSVFGAMSIYGYTTKKDLSEWRSFLAMGLIGIIIASIINLFLGSTMVYFIVSIAVVVVFTGLTAYDTQKIKEIYFNISGVNGGNSSIIMNNSITGSTSSSIESKVAVYGALHLYLNFINLFLVILRFVGEKKE